MSILAQQDLWSPQRGTTTRFEVVADDLQRTILTERGARTSSVGLAGKARTVDADAFDRAWLRSGSWPSAKRLRGTIEVCDLFCGSGGMTLGAWEAARALELGMRPVLALDNDADAMAVYRENFAPEHSFACGIEELLDGEPGSATSAVERRLERQLASIDLLLAGPPCQGHSDLNNHTRRADPRNALVLRVARFAELFSPTHIVIENVQGARHDRSGAFPRCEGLLRASGYHVETFLLQAAQVGVAQRRRRCFMVASRTKSLSPASLESHYTAEERTFDWACGDLVEGDGVFDTAADVSPTNAARMRYLIDNDLYELPNSERPDCHRLKPHGYASVYGRLRADAPAPTITTGFGSPGQGRYAFDLAGVVPFASAAEGIAVVLPQAAGVTRRLAASDQVALTDEDEAGLRRALVAGGVPTTAP